MSLGPHILIQEPIPPPHQFPKSSYKAPSSLSRAPMPPFKAKRNKLEDTWKKTFKVKCNKTENTLKKNYWDET